MKTIDIVGENYSGKWDRSRTACRGIITEGQDILLSYETKNDLWMTPGGGMEPGENEKECCIREIAEETGLTVDVSDCLLEINEYYGNGKWVHRYFRCRVTGKTERRLTKGEQEAGMEPRWISVEDCIRIFSAHGSYAGTDEGKRGMYLREYRAVSELL